MENPRLSLTFGGFMYVAACWLLCFVIMAVSLDSHTIDIELRPGGVELEIERMKEVEREKNQIEREEMGESKESIERNPDTVMAARE